MLTEARHFQIEPQTLQTLQALGRKILDVVDQWKSKHMQRASASAQTKVDALADIKRYIAKQRGGKLFIGTAAGWDNNEKRQRTFRVYLSSSTNTGGYFDDFVSKEELLQIKQVAQARGIDYAVRKFREPIHAVRYALDTPEDEMQELLPDKGYIVLDVGVINQPNVYPRIMDLLTHEYTHAAQHYKTTSSAYSQAAALIHRDEDLSSDQLLAYYSEPMEFEAQLRGFIGYLQARYDELGDREALKQTYTPQQLMKRTGLDYKESLDTLIKQQQRDYIKSLDKCVFQLSKSAAREMDEHVDEIQSDMLKAKRMCQVGIRDACTQHEQLKAKYPIISSPYREFICTIAQVDKLWKRLKLSVYNFIQTLA